jgi:DNA-3-methyladenine glycosylase I
VPIHDDRHWFEKITLDGFQAGLSWKTILHKRDAFRDVFQNFEPEKVARMTVRQREKALKNPGIVRNRMKVEATVKNAKAFLKLQEEHGSFDAWIWSFTDGKVVHNPWKTMKQIPATSPLGDRVSKALKKEGFSFVGPTIVYAFLQAAGVINDHLVTCYRYKQLLGK